MGEERRSRRVLIIGLSTYWGGRLAKALEDFDEIETIIGVDSSEPTVELERTEYVKVGTRHSLLHKIVTAAEIDTVVDARLIVDSIHGSRSEIHENNVIGTLNILAACSGPGSTVKKLVFKTSAHWYGCEQDDPAFFTETMQRRHPPRTPLEKSLVEAEAAIAEFGEKFTEVTVTVLRCVNVLGPEIETSHTRLLGLPAVPVITGFDPRYQFVHSDDVVHALEHALLYDVPGTFNIAGDGVLVLSEVIGLLDKYPLPIIPPWGAGLLLAPLKCVGFSLPPEMMQQLRFGRAIDNRRYRATGFEYQYTTREAVLWLAEEQRLKPVLPSIREPYRYEREVEDFLRLSPNVRASRGRYRVGREDAAMFDPSPPVD